VLTDLSTWVDIGSGFDLAGSLITRIIQDTANNYYVSTQSTGVWKSKPMLAAKTITHEQAVTVFPNPFNHRTTVRSAAMTTGWTQIELRDILGAIVWQGRKYTASATVSIEVQGIPPGNYLLVLRTNERTETQWVTIVQ
jgi:hypothetical protein